MISQAAPTTEPLVRETSITLPKVSGRIDHLAIDLRRNRLFVAELGNDSVDVVDLATGKIESRIVGVSAPQGLGYAEGPDPLVVASGGDGTVKFFSGADYSLQGSLALGEDADNVRFDRRSGAVAVGYGSGGLAVVDPVKRVKLDDIALPAHPEGFQLEADRVFVNVPEARRIVVVDRKSGKVADSWSMPSGGNFPMALDPSGDFVAVVFRDSSNLALLDAETGRVRAEAQTCRDADDVFLDAKRAQFYVSCGEGAVEAFTMKDLTRLGRVESSAGARTALFVPELDRLFVAEPAGRSGGDAAIEVFRPN